MIAVDTNILVYAHRVDAPFHAVAVRCVTTLAEGRAAWAISWPCVHEFLGSVTRQRVFDPPTPLDAALARDLDGLLRWWQDGRREAPEPALGAASPMPGKPALARTCEAQRCQTRHRCGEGAGTNGRCPV